MTEVSKEFLERMNGGEVEWVDGGEGAFDPEDYADDEGDEDVDSASDDGK